MSNQKKAKIFHWEYPVIFINYRSLFIAVPNFELLNRYRVPVLRKSFFSISKRNLIIFLIKDVFLYDQ